jgi:hypothetical protein
MMKRKLISAMIVLLTAIWLAAPALGAHEDTGEAVEAVDSFYRALALEDPDLLRKVVSDRYELPPGAMARTAEKYAAHNIVEKFVRELPDGTTVVTVLAMEYDIKQKPASLFAYSLEMGRENWEITGRELLSGEENGLFKQYKRMVWSSTLGIVSLISLLILAIPSVTLGVYTLRRYDPAINTRMQRLYAMVVTVVGSLVIIFAGYQVLILLAAG